MSRPSLYRPEYAPQARKLCLFGFTNAQLADYFEVSHATIDNWRNEHPEFRAAMREGKAYADAEVVAALFKRACGYDYDGKHYPPDPTAGIWWSKNRMGWRDKPEEPTDPSTDAASIRDALRAMDEADGE